ncbi:hypothetical protein [Bacteroides sp.]|uniref:hypothetical protein n=1 Tax=Bacteroides sp. TaxID=29523 RepID=UPI003A8F2997
MNRLYSMAQAFVDKYNAEYNCTLRLQRFSENGFSLPYIKSENIYVDKSTHIWLAFYYFGNPNLFLYYRLLKGMLDFNNADGALTLLNLIKAEYRSASDRFHYMLSQNPEWIPAQVMIITLHELAHHMFRKDRNSYQLFLNDAKDFLQNRPFNISKDYVPNVDFKAAGINFEEMREFSEEIYDAIIEDDVEDETFLEELAADSFVFNHLSQSLSGCGANQVIVSSMALSGSCVFFLEYTNRTNKLFFTSINEDKKERVRHNFIMTIIDSVNSRIRAIYQDFHINNFFAAENIDDDSRMLYSTLVGVPLSNFNESLDVEFMKSLQPFQDILSEGGQIEFDENKLKFIRQEVDTFENAIICSILNELDKKSTFLIR